MSSSIGITPLGYLALALVLAASVWYLAGVLPGVANGDYAAQVAAQQRLDAQQAAGMEAVGRALVAADECLPELLSGDTARATAAAAKYRAIIDGVTPDILAGAASAETSLTAEGN